MWWFSDFACSVLLNSLCFGAWVDFIFYFSSWSFEQTHLREGSQPGASQLSTSGGHGSVSKVCTSHWTKSKNMMTRTLRILTNTIAATVIVVMSQLWLVLLIPQAGFDELPFNKLENFQSYPDICFIVDGYNFLCHKVTKKLTQHA